MSNDQILKLIEVEIKLNEYEMPCYRMTFADSNCRTYKIKIDKPRTIEAM
jgi:hypothetical protein